MTERPNRIHVQNSGTRVELVGNFMLIQIIIKIIKRKGGDT